MKEADEIKLQPLPTGQAYRAWRMATIHVIIAAAGRRDNRAMDWVLVVDEASIDELGHPGTDRASLVRMLASAIAEIAHGELGRQITMMSSSAICARRIEKGRRLLRLVFSYYASEQQTS